MCGTDYYYRHMPALGKKLDEIVPIKSPTKTHFANSGAEAVETALKLAMYHTGRQKFISFFGSFHGRTLGALSLTSSKKAQRSGFKRQPLDVVHVPYPNWVRSPFAGVTDPESAGRASIDWIENRIFQTTTPPEEVAGIVVEMVQGEGGYVPAPKSFIKELRRICDEHGIMLIVDEVARADIMDWHKGAHASTFGGNPVCIASALKTIELLENGLVENAATVGEYLQEGLRKLQDKYDCIGEVRGLGLMVGVEFVEDRATMKAAPELRDKIEFECFNRGLIILGCGANTIRWSPPLILTKENVDVALQIFDEAIAASL
jgi:4-aminobutyrate aminotransferase